MESLIASDWLKDYGPLFDMFDEEMRAGQVPTSDYFNDDLNNYYNANYKQTDELSLILGLEWMPNLELNSPCSTSCSSTGYNSVSPGSSSSSSLPSPAAVTPTLPTTGGGPILAPATNPLPSSTSVSVTVSKKASVVVGGPTQSPAISPTCCSSSSSSPSAVTITKPAQVASLKESMPVIDSQNSNSSSNSNSLGSSVKRRKKCPRMKGTSLLAQPAAVSSPLKLAGSTSSSGGSSSSILHNSSNSNGVNNTSPTAAATTTIISPVATPLSTLVTFSNKNNRLPQATTTPMAASIPSSLTTQNLTTLASTKTISTTTNHNLFSPKHLNLITTSSCKQPLLQLQQKQPQQSQPHQQQPLIFLSARTNLTTSVKPVRYSVKIEHAYSLS